MNKEQFEQAMEEVQKFNSKLDSMNSALDNLRSDLERREAALREPRPHVFRQRFTKLQQTEIDEAGEHVYREPTGVITHISSASNIIDIYTAAQPFYLHRYYGSTSGTLIINILRRKADGGETQSFGRSYMRSNTTTTMDFGRIGIKYDTGDTLRVEKTSAANLYLTFMISGIDNIINV